MRYHRLRYYNDNPPLASVSTDVTTLERLNDTKELVDTGGGVKVNKRYSEVVQGNVADLFIPESHKYFNSVIAESLLNRFKGFSVMFEFRRTLAMQLRDIPYIKRVFPKYFPS